MSRRPIGKKFEFLTTLNHKNDDYQVGNIVAEIRYVVNWYNDNNENTRIDQVIIAAPVDERGKQYKVYFHLDEYKEAVNYQHFTNEGNNGGIALKKYDWKCPNSSYDNCKVAFAELMTSQKWALPDLDENEPQYFQIPLWLEEKLADSRKNIDLNAITDPDKQFCQKQLLKDFSIKMMEGKITGYQDYYVYANKKSVDFSSKVAQNMTTLKAIEVSEKAKQQELPPLKTMLESLKEYINTEQVQKFNSDNEMILKIGGRNSQYYFACYTITRVMLLVKDEKQRGVILYGIPGSGKSFIARFMDSIFDCHFKEQTKDIFDQKITREEANKQLYIIDEANMGELFKKKDICHMKRLTEGFGINLRNMYTHSFTGFIGSFQLFTCLYLVCPFIAPKSSKSGWDQNEFKLDQRALIDRIRLVEFTKRYGDSYCFFNEKDWAACMIFMAENFEELDVPALFQDGQDGLLADEDYNEQEQADIVPDKVLQDEIVELRLKLKERDDEIKLQQEEIERLNKVPNQKAQGQIFSQAPQTPIITNNVNYNFQQSPNMKIDIENKSSRSQINTPSPFTTRHFQNTGQNQTQQNISKIRQFINKRNRKYDMKLWAKGQQEASGVQEDSELLQSNMSQLDLNDGQSIFSGNAWEEEPWKDNAFPKKNSAKKVLKQEGKRVNQKSDAQKVKEAFAQHDYNEKGIDDFRIISQKYTWLENEDIANSDLAKEEDKIVQKKQRDMENTGLFEDKAVVGKQEQDEESVEEFD